ncbi:hypothetical protein NIES4103_66380 [Nostoc sp. NIES-4103]|nr:hypothetical protein NIES4103_66380 [Nostoc sp. NIES-4103]
MKRYKVLHGSQGDGCWNPKVCHNRRSFYRNRSKDYSGQIEAIAVEAPETYFAVLYLYKESGDKPLTIWDVLDEISEAPPTSSLAPVWECLDTELETLAVEAQLAIAQGAVRDAIALHRLCVSDKAQV